MNSSFLMCPKAGHKHRYVISSSLEFLAISSFPQLLRCKTNMVASYRVVPYLQCCYAWVVTSSAVHNYWKCYINVVTRTCSGFYWYIRTLPRALCALGSHAYISVKPLTAVLQYINVHMQCFVAVFVFLYWVCMFAFFICSCRTRHFESFWIPLIIIIPINYFKYI